MTLGCRRMPWTSTWTLTSSRIDSFAHLGESSCPAGRLRKCEPTTPETRSRAVDVQLLVSKHTASSLRQRPRSRRRSRPRGNRRGAWLASRHREVAGASGEAWAEKAHGALLLGSVREYVVLLMLTWMHRSTIFPYTTLFRSDVDVNEFSHRLICTSWRIELP